MLSEENKKVASSTFCVQPGREVARARCEGRLVDESRDTGINASRVKKNKSSRISEGSCSF